MTKGVLRSEMTAKILKVAYEAVVTESCEDALAEPLQGITNHVANRIFVSNFDRQTTEDELKRVFERTGEITDINIVRNAQCGRCYGFVTFRNVEDCTKLLKMKDRLTLTIRNKALTFSPARFKPRKSQGTPDIETYAPEHANEHLVDAARPSALPHSNRMPPVIMHGTTYYNHQTHGLLSHPVGPDPVMPGCYQTNIPVYHPPQAPMVFLHPAAPLAQHPMYMYH